MQPPQHSNTWNYPSFFIAAHGISLQPRMSANSLWLFPIQYRIFLIAKGKGELRFSIQSLLLLVDTQCIMIHGVTYEMPPKHDRRRGPGNQDAAQGSPGGSLRRSFE